MLPLCLTVIFLFSWSSGQTVNDCPAGVPRTKYLKLLGGNCFEFVLDYPLEYNAAIKDCRTHGGTLAIVNSPDVTTFLIDQLVYEFGDASKIWIGLNDKVTEGQYVWEDGKPLGTYQNWAPNRNGTSNLHDCVYFDPSKNGEWDEQFCSNFAFGLITFENNYVCEYKTRATTTTVPSG